MNKLTLLTITILAAACGSDGLNGPSTFAEGAELISEAFCERSVECGARTPESVGYCIDSNIYQLCELSYDCSLEISPELADKFEQCAEELAVLDCTSQLPDVCIEVIYP